MKAIKTLLAASALATVASATNATVWNITMTASKYFAGANGDLNVNYSGIWDSTTQAGAVGGHISMPGFTTEIDYLLQIFQMDAATGKGVLNQPDSSASNCTSNTTSACAGFAFAGALYNDIRFSFDTVVGSQINTSVGTPFTASVGTFVWTAVFSSAENGVINLYALPFTVTLSSLAPPVPIPTSAWLFGSGLLGLAGAARRRLK